MNMFVITHVMGALGALSNVISTWQKTRKRILLFLLFDGLFYSLQYILLGAYAGAVTNVIGMFRTFLFSKKGKNKFFSTKWPLFIVIFIYVISNFFTYDGITSLFPAIASIIYAFVLWQDEPRKIRIGSSIMLAMWCIYNAIVGAYVGIVVEAILLVSAISAIVKIDVLGKKEDNKTAKSQKKE